MTDQHPLLGYSTVLTPPSPATSGPSLILAAGGGTALAGAAVPPFNVTVWPTGVQPVRANAEILRVTNIATNTLSIERAQEGSSARAIVAGDQIAATITPKSFADVAGDWQPSDLGYLAWNFDPIICNAPPEYNLGRKERLELMAIRIPQGITVSNVWISLYAALAQEGTQNLVGLYDASGKRLGQSGNLAPVFTAATEPGPVALPLQAPVSLPAGRCYAGFLMNGGLPRVLCANEGAFFSAQKMADYPHMRFLMAVEEELTALPGQITFPTRAELLAEDQPRNWVALS
jgi:hypothetical protein